MKRLGRGYIRGNDNVFYHSPTPKILNSRNYDFCKRRTKYIIGLVCCGVGSGCGAIFELEVDT